MRRRKKRKKRKAQLQGAQHLRSVECPSVPEKLENGTTFTKDLVENRDELVLSGVQREAGSKRDS